jgi:uncharacterized protein
VIDDHTIAFADFRGNKQFISTGNLGTNNRIALLLVDYPRQAHLKILGRAEIFEGEGAREWIERLREPDYKAVVERVYVIRVEAFDWNCPQHITPAFHGGADSGSAGAVRAPPGRTGTGKRKNREANFPQKD